MAQFARPDSTVANGSWAIGGSSPAATRHESIDDVTPDDGVTLIVASSTTAGQFGLSDITDPEVGTGHILRYRIGKVGGNDRNITIRLLDGTTEIASFVHVAASGWTTYADTLTTTQADAITNYADLRITLQRANGGTNQVQVTWAELETPDAPSGDRVGLLTWAELETPNAPRLARLTWAELEIPSAPRLAIVPWAEMEAPTAPRLARITWAELEAPNAPRFAIVTWSELEVPALSADRLAVLTWGELEVPTAPRLGIVSWAEIEAPTAPRLAVVSWSELEVPDILITDRTVYVMWVELEVPELDAAPPMPQGGYSQDYSRYNRGVPIHAGARGVPRVIRARRRLGR